MLVIRFIETVKFINRGNEKMVKAIKSLTSLSISLGQGSVDYHQEEDLIFNFIGIMMQFDEILALCLTMDRRLNNI